MIATPGEEQALRPLLRPSLTATAKLTWSGKGADSSPAPNKVFGWELTCFIHQITDVPRHNHGRQ